jgi:hypothetical protein
MTENDIKEQLSNNYIKIIAANKGYMLDKPGNDYGADFMVSRTTTYIHNGSTRYLKDNKYIDIQLKATTENGITIDAASGTIKYTLEVKNFNDLVVRKNTNNLTPLVLILYILPVDKNHWVDMNNNEILLRKNAYWYVPPDGTAFSNNVATVTITIPQTNVLDINCFDTFYQNFYN